jgi:hypothetical protein
MSAKTPAGNSEKVTKVVGNPEALSPTLKQVGGSQSDDWNNVLANQTLNTLWLAHSNEEFQERLKLTSYRGPTPPFWKR